MEASFKTHSMPKREREGVDLHSTIYQSVSHRFGRNSPYRAICPKLVKKWELMQELSPETQTLTTMPVGVDNLIIIIPIKILISKLLNLTKM